MKNIVIFRVLAILFVTAWGINATATSEECNEEIFLPREVFKYKGKDSRSVWLGATNISEDFKEHIKGIDGKLKTMFKRGFYETPARLHVTIKYLGLISPDICAQKTIIKALSEVLVFPMKLMPSKLSILKNPDGSPRLIVLVFETPNVKLFKMSVENALDGFAGRDSRPYWPHMTIYTFPKDAKPLTKAQEEKILGLDVSGPALKINGFEFVQSVMGGAHVVLQAFGEKGLNLERIAEIKKAEESKLSEEEPKPVVEEVKPCKETVRHEKCTCICEP